MTDAAWMSLAPIIGAVALLLGAVSAFSSSIAARRSGKATTAANAATTAAKETKTAVEIVDKKTDDQTTKLDTIDTKADVAATAAAEAAHNTNSRMDEALKQIEAVSTELVNAKAIIAAQNKLLEMFTKSGSEGGRRTDDKKIGGTPP